MAAEIKRQARAIALVTAYIKQKWDKDGEWDIDANQPMSASFDEVDVSIVWWCYILGGWKTLITTSIPDGMYYEVTYNKDREETYLDAYKKVDNVCLPDTD